MQWENNTTGHIPDPSSSAQGPCQIIAELQVTIFFPPYLVPQEISILLTLLWRLPVQPNLCGRNRLSLYSLWLSCWYCLTDIYCYRTARWARTLRVERHHHNVIVRVASQVLQHHLVGLFQRTSGLWAWTLPSQCHSYSCGSGISAPQSLTVS